MSLATIMPTKKAGGDERMRRRLFRWPCGGIEVVHAALPYAARPGLHWKPLDAAIGRLLALYCPGGRQGDKQYEGATCVHFADHFDGHGGAPVLYTAHIAQWRRFMAFIKATTHHHWARTLAPIGINWTCVPLFQGYISSSHC